MENKRCHFISLIVTKSVTPCHRHHRHDCDLERLIMGGGASHFRHFFKCCGPSCLRSTVVAESTEQREKEGI